MVNLHVGSWLHRPINVLYWGMMQTSWKKGFSSFGDLEPHEPCNPGTLFSTHLCSRMKRSCIRIKPLESMAELRNGWSGRGVEWFWGYNLKLKKNLAIKPSRGESDIHVSAISTMLKYFLEKALIFITKICFTSQAIQDLIPLGCIYHISWYHKNDFS